MGTVITTESLTELAKVLESFFKGLAECGLLTAYSVQLQGSAVDFAVQIKFQFLLLQFVRSLQNVLVKIPSVPGQEYTREIATQTSEQSDYVEVNASTANMPEHLGSLVFTQTPDPLSWVEDEERGLKGEISASFIAQSKALGTNKDIIVTCHPAALAAIISHSFVATPIAEISHPPSCESVLLKPWIESERVTRECGATGEGANSAESLPANEQIKTENVDKSTSDLPSSNYLNSSTETLENVAVMGLKPFLTTSASDSIKGEEFGSGQEMEPLVLNSYEEEHSSDCDGMNASTTNVMHIVLASTAMPPVGSPETPVLEQGDEKKDVVKQGDIFNEGFASGQTLQKQSQSEQEGKASLNCAVCDKHFVTKLSFRRHMDTHSGKKGAVCYMCGKAFSRPDYLQKHYMIHTGHRPYQCSVCSRQFISSSQLKVHQKTHTGVKEHVCDICNRAFSRGDKLKDHMLRHLNIKRFHCTLCKRDYAEKRDLTKHLKVHAT